VLCEHGDARVCIISYFHDHSGEGTLQAARFYVPAIGAIALLGAWLVTRIPGRAWLAGAMSVVVVTAMFSLGVWSFHTMTFGAGIPERACVTQNLCNALVLPGTPPPNSQIHVHASLSLGTISRRWGFGH
jgi:hypothetical protein